MNNDSISKTNDGKIAIAKMYEKQDGTMVTSRDIITTSDELTSYGIILGILASRGCDPKKASMRDAKSCCAVYYDDNNRKPICKLIYKSDLKKVEIFEAGKSEESKTYELEDILALAGLRNKIRKSYKYWEELEGAQKQDVEKDVDVEDDDVEEQSTQLQVAEHLATKTEPEQNLEGELMTQAQIAYARARSAFYSNPSDAEEVIC